MSAFIPLTIAMIAALLIFARGRRLAAQSPPPRTADPRPRALTEAAASGVTVLAVGWILAGLTPAPWYLHPLFTILAMGICLSQYRKTINARRA